METTALDYHLVFTRERYLSFLANIFTCSTARQHLHESVTTSVIHYFSGNRFPLFSGDCWITPNTFYTPLLTIGLFLSLLTL